jgi:hypothetical protein
MNDIYATPEADLGVNHSSDRAGGSIEDAISGNIEISMLGTMGEAWRGLKGFKFKCHIALVIYFVVYLVAILVSYPVILGLIALGADQATAGIMGFVIQMVAVVVTMPMAFGVLIMGMRHAQRKPASAGSIFGYFSSIPSLFLVYILQTILVLIGLALLVLPGIYLMFAYMFAMPLVVEKKMSAWQALETSRKAVTHVWFRFFGITWLMSLIFMLGILTLGIAWIWTLPWSVLAIAMIYTKLFGVESHTLSE